jgi:hypothetical protein
MLDTSAPGLEILFLIAKTTHLVHIICDCFVAHSYVPLGSTTPPVALPQPISIPCKRSSAPHKRTVPRRKKTARLCAASRKLATEWASLSPRLHCGSHAVSSRSGWRIIVIDSGRHSMRSTCMEADSSRITQDSTVGKAKVTQWHVANSNQSLLKSSALSSSGLRFFGSAFAGPSISFLTSFAGQSFRPFLLFTQEPWNHQSNRSVSD